MLKNKKALIVGVASNRSIAYGIAKKFHEFGAELAFTYQNERLQERITNIAHEFNSNIVLPCDVASDAEIEGMFKGLQNQWKTFDILVHAVAFAPRNQFEGDYINVIDRESFRIAHDISSYSFAALSKAALPYLNPNSSLITLSYLGAEKVVPNYNIMGIAKASLEANMRYIASNLGKQHIRVNAISAGAIKTLAAAGIKNFKKMLSFGEKNAPLPQHLTTDDIGNVAAFLGSNLANAITGEVIHVDNGMHILALPELD